MPGFAASQEVGVAELALQRVDGEARVAFRADAEGRTRLETLYQRGAAKIRLPNVYGGAPEAVLLNASGGVTEGDRLSFSVAAGAGARAVVATQAAERIYRAPAERGSARLRNRIELGPGARLDWLAQETILFDRGRLDRRLEVEMAPDAQLLAIEPIVFGREAMGERVERAHLCDHWRIRRGGRLVYADGIRIEGPFQDIQARAATFGGRRAAASLVYVAPDAEDRLAAARRDLGEAASREPGALAAASAWNGVLSARLTARSGASLMRAAAAFLEAFRGAPAPRVWRC